MLSKLQIELDALLTSGAAGTVHPIGTWFLPVGKNKRPQKVVDIITSFNSKGDLIAVRYVSEHDFCGQTVVARDLPRATVSRGIMNLSASGKTGGSNGTA